MARHPGRGGAAWRRVAAQVLADATHCHLCGEPLDFDAPPCSPRSPSVDHEVALSLMAGADAETQRKMALDPANLRPAHFGCNSARGIGRPKPPRRSSREW